jgi:hypothetical protein
MGEAHSKRSARFAITPADYQLKVVRSRKRLPSVRILSVDPLDFAAATQWAATQQDKPVRAYFAQRAIDRLMRLQRKKSLDQKVIELALEAGQLLTFARLEAGGFASYLYTAQRSRSGSSRGGNARSEKFDRKWEEISARYKQLKGESPHLSKHEICEQLHNEFDLEVETLKIRLRKSGEVAPKRQK